MVNKERVRLLVKGLRSGEFGQARDVLHDQVTDGYCCLGVATVVAIRNGLGPPTGNYLETSNYLDWGVEHLHPAVVAWYGFDPHGREAGDGGNPSLQFDSEPGQISATVANDERRYTFDQIADAFERTYLQDPES